MIKQQTVLMVTPLAMIAAEKGVDLDSNASDVIKGLNQTTGAVTEYTEDNIAVALPDVTAKSGDHTDVMEATTDIIAARIRQALGVISKQVKPALRKVEDEIRNIMDARNVVETIFDYCRVEMVNIEPAFFNSPFYPKDIPAAFKDTMAVKFSDLLKGSYPQMDPADLQELIAVEFDDLRTFFSDGQEIQQVYNSLFVEKNWYFLFNGGSVNNGVASIADPENYNFDSFRSIVILNLLANKLVSLEDPLPGVTGVALDDYRNSLIITRELAATMLVRFRQIWEQRAAAGVVILDKDVQYAKAVGGNMEGGMVLNGSILVGYNNAVLSMFAQAEDMSLSEFAVGYVYAKNRGYRVTDIITDKDTVMDAFKEYTTDISMVLTQNKTTIASKLLVNTLGALYADEQFKETIENLNDDVPASQRIVQRLRARLDIDKFFGDIQFLDSVVKGETSLMNTRLGATLAGAFDSPLAEEILTVNAQNKPGSVEHQRKMLSKSIAAIIVKNLLVG